MTHSGLADPFMAKSLNFSWWVDYSAREACNPASRCPCICYWHAELGADGEDYRANFVHAPFSGNSQQWSALKGSRSAARERG